MSEQEKRQERNERSLLQAQEGSWVLGPEGIPMVKTGDGWRLGSWDVLEESILSMHEDDDIVVYQLVEAPQTLRLTVTFVLDDWDPDMLEGEEGVASLIGQQMFGGEILDVRINRESTY